MANKAAGKRYFGNVRKLPSGRFQARYTGPDGHTYTARRNTGGPLTFDTRGDAEAWLTLRHSEILRNEWLPPAAPKAAPVTLDRYADAWLESRGLEDTTREHYQQLLRDHVYPTFGDCPVTGIEPAAVRTWHAEIGKHTGPPARAHAYALLRTVLNTAVADDLIPANPCRVRGAGQSKRVKKIVPASLAEIEVLTTAMPGKYQLMVLLAAWCGLRFGELAEMRRADMDLTNGVVHVRRGVVRTKTGRKVKGPKSEAGKRPVAIPPHLLPGVKAHLRDHAAMGRDGLLFPAQHGEQLAPSTLYRVYYPAREKAGRPDLRFHDLRHTGAVLAASTGATLAELMARLGHSTPGAALRYQHAAKDRDRVVSAPLGPPQTPRGRLPRILLIRMVPCLDALGYYPLHTPQTPASTSSATHAEHRPSGRLMRIPESSLSPEITHRADVPPMPPNWLRTFRPAWRALVGWPAQTPVGHGPTESSDRQPEPETGVRRMSAAAGPGGGAALVGASVAPPPILPPPTDSREHSERPVDAGQCAHLRALSTTLPTPDREIILLWAVAGVPTPDIAATLGITPTAVRLAQSRALSALPPAATANGPPPATRQRVVLLPHVRNHPTTTAQEATR